MKDWTLNDDQVDYRFEDEIGADDLGSMTVGVVPRSIDATDQGPCLYLGPSGQRCNRRAVKGGFCELHQPGAKARSKAGKRSKIVAAIAGLLGVLWPYIYDFVHQLIRLIYPR